MHIGVVNEPLYWLKNMSQIKDEIKKEIEDQIKETPKYLYHYTTIETLALILKNKKLLFNSLANVDDLEEQQTRDLADFGKFCYASCWTDDPDDNIALWSMYANNGTGIRIRLPANMFEHFDQTLDKNQGCIPGYTVLGPTNITLNQVFYTKDYSLIVPDIFEKEDNGFSLFCKLLGVIKNKRWSFQEEWRFGLCILPSSLIHILVSKTPEEIYQCCKTCKPAASKYLVPIDNESFSDMEILLGPSTNEAEQIKVESLVESFFPSLDPKSVIKQSKLRNSVRFKK